MNFPGRYSGVILIWLVICLPPFGAAQISPDSPLPEAATQMLVVLTESFDSPQGILARFQRREPGSEWQKTGEERPVVLGAEGLAWGRGLHARPGPESTLKTEGDGKSPAGVFTLNVVFGYAPEEYMDTLKMPYRFISEVTECVDDEESRYYNSIVERDEVDEVDWNSSEKMRFVGIWYELGVEVDHNVQPVEPGAGSCIFLHNWAHAYERTSGCTALAPRDLEQIVAWLDASRLPVLVQLPDSVYQALKTAWGLPEFRYDRDRGR